MSHGRLRGAVLAVIIIACLAVQCSVSVSGLVVGERMSYVVQLAGIPVGEQLVAVSEELLPGEKKVYVLSSRTMSAGLAALLISVDDEIEVQVDSETLFPVHVRMKFRENDRQDDWAVAIEENGSIVATVRNLKQDTVREEVLPRRPLDLLSLIYWAREQELRVGQTYNVLLLDPSDAEFRDIVFRVDREEIAYTYMGQFPALVCYREGEEQSISVWFSDDEKHLPLYVEIATPAGVFTAVLKGVYPDLRTGVPQLQQ